MTRTLLAALLALSPSTSLAQQVGESFTVPTLGDAAAKVQDLREPLALELHIPLPPTRVFPLEALHGFLTRNGFGMEVQTALENGEPVPGAPMVLVAKKHAVMSKEDIDAYNAEVARILPKDTKVSWRFAVPKATGIPRASVPAVAPPGI